MDIRVNKNIWRLVCKLAESEEFEDEDDVVNKVLRDYIKRETELALDQDPPTKEHVKQVVLDLKPAIIERDVVSISLFGSVLHGDAGKDSDIDFMVDLNPDKESSMLPLIRVKELLEERFDRAVDVVMKSAITQKWRSRGFDANEAMRIF